jgi:predicted transcriptional regulator
VEPQERKEAWMQLMKERAGAVKAAAARARQQKKDLDLIKDRLAQGPATPPEIARDTGLPAGQTMWYLAAMRKYGLVNEAAKSGDYFTYELKPQETDAG